MRVVAQNAMQLADLPEPCRGDVAVYMLFRLPDHQRKDLDNLSKGVLDGMNDVVFHDDVQVTTLVLNKIVSVADNPGVDVTVVFFN